MMTKGNPASVLFILWAMLCLAGCGSHYAKVIDANAALIGNSTQLIIVGNEELSSAQAAAAGFEFIGGNWVPVTAAVSASVGRSGFARLGEKREGDGKTPSGVFALGTAFGYGESASVKMPYRQATEEDFWVDDAQSSAYNTWVKGLPVAVSFEKMRRDDDLYKYGIVIEYNTGPVVKGLGSAIFMHIWKAYGESTSGCVALSEPDLLGIMNWLDPSRKPLLIMGTFGDMQQGFIAGAP